MPRLEIALIESAWAAKPKNGGYLQAQFNRLRARARSQAIGAVAASIVRAVMLENKWP